MGKRKNKNQDRKKVSLVFDEAKRKDFLCGFRKRKLERKKKAQEEIQRMLKEERKRIKQENKESYKKLIVSSRPIPDIEQLLQEEYEDDDVNVKIVELSSDTLQKKDLVIGENKPKESVEKKKPKKVKDSDVVKEIPGMGLEEESDEGSDNDNEEEEEQDGEDKLKTKKEIKSMLKKQATKKIQKSKVFQMKSKLDRIQNKKKSLQKKQHMKGKANPRKIKSGARNGKEDSRKPKQDLRKHKSKKKGSKRK